MNLGPSGYEPDELPGCSTPRQDLLNYHPDRESVKIFKESIFVYIASGIVCGMDASFVTGSSGKDLQPMDRAPLRYLLPILFLAVAAVSARGVMNPHVEPATCSSCHTKVPTDEEGQAGDYFLIKETIDDTCEVCHPYTCCDIGSLHEKEHNHPSNIRTWNRNSGPRTLPVFSGYITCATCHFHRAAQGNDYKLVRIVKIDENKIDWSGLCHDCHEDY